MSSEPKMVTLEIDGNEIRALAGTPLIDACHGADVEVPHFCYHKDLSIAGNCRMCAVEVENARGLPISCATPVAEGMIVRTDTERVKSHRAAIMEFLLVNHPIDCPICDQAGECMLQVYYMDHDLRASRLSVDKVHYDKRVLVGPEVVLDQERCVECTRCIRFCDEVTGTGELRMNNRGDRCVITTFPDTPLSNDYSVNTADICPVGALTQRDFRFKARVWFLQEAESICGGCARGCNTIVDYGWHQIVTDYNGKAYRVRPRRNPEVNRSWMCDFGRGGYRQVNENRVLKTTSAGEGVALKKGIELAAKALKDAGNVLIIASLDSSLEEMHLLKRLGEDVLEGARVVAVPHRPDGIEDDLLLRADKHPNRKGAEWLGILTERTELPGLLAGRRGVLIHQADLLAMDTDGALHKTLMEVPVRVMIATSESATTGIATHLLPGCSFIEKSGHWANFEGRLQRFFKGRHMDVLEGAADDLAVIAGLSGGTLPAVAREVFSSLPAAVPALQGLDWTSAGQDGVIPGTVHAGVEV